MRKIRKKTTGPTWRDSWVMVPIGVALLLVIVALVYWGTRAEREELSNMGWMLVARGAPKLQDLGEPALALEPAQFAQVLATEAQALIYANVKWILVYDLTDPAARAEVIFFRETRVAADYVARTPGLTPAASATAADQRLGVEVYTAADGRVWQRRGRVLTRVKSSDGGVGAAMAAGQRIDEAIQKTFGAEP